jgi:S1-C subfamily serine protease
MGIPTFLASFFVGILSAFLALTSGMESLMRSGLEYIGAPKVIDIDNSIEAPAVPPLDQGTTEDTPDVSVLPSIYEEQEYGGAIPNILIATPFRQEASVVLSEAKSNEVIPKSTTSPIVARDVSIKDALVNIFCTMRTKNQIRATTGSGVFIHENGVILTNAHVAQFLLLSEPRKGIKTTCTVRTGTPAVPRYYADLLYIPPLWVNENAKELHSESPSGTGERDYALLYVTEAIDSTLPERFPALPPLVEPFTNAAKNQVVRAAGFPAEIVRTEGSKASISPVVATTTITELFTYTAKKVDLVGIAPSAVGEQGSSGGPIVDLSGNVIGLITTKGDAAKDGERSLRAITLPYIDRTITEETRVGLLDTISGDLRARAEGFRKIMTPLLSGIVFEGLSE